MLNLVFERALKELPGSYKLWYNYLKVNFNKNKTKSLTDAIHQSLSILGEKEADEG